MRTRWTGEHLFESSVISLGNGTESDANAHSVAEDGGRLCGVRESKAKFGDLHCGYESVKL